MLCPSCGQPNAPTAEVCATCGQSLVHNNTPDSVEHTSIDTDFDINFKIDRMPARAVQEPIPPSVPITTASAPIAQENFIRSPMPTPGPAISGAVPPPAHGYPAPTAFSAPCRVCGTNISALNSTCPRCRTPMGMIVNPDDPTFSTYISMVNAAEPFGRQQALRPTADPTRKQGETTQQIPAGWNWGAAFLTLLWAFTHRVFWYVALQLLLIGLLLTVGIVAIALQDDSWGGVFGLTFVAECVLGIIFRVYFGVAGNALAWKSRQFDSIAACLEAQEIWKVPGFASAIVQAFVVVVVFGMLIFFYIVGSSMQ